MSKFTLAVRTNEYLIEQGIRVAMGTYSDLDDEGLEVAFYTANGTTYLRERYSVSEWTNAIAIGDHIINLFNHDGNIPPRKGERLYAFISQQFRFNNTWRTRKKALENASLEELLAAYLIAERAGDSKTARILGIHIDAQ